MARRPNDPQRRERILQATLDTIAAHGIHAVTHRKIATCANVPLGSLTYYFSGIEALIEEAFSLFTAEMSAQYQQGFVGVTNREQACDAIADLIFSAQVTTARNMEPVSYTHLLWSSNLNADGVKTGTTAGAGYNLVSSATQGDMRLIAVVLGTKTDRIRFNESEKLLTWGFRFFETVTPIKPDATFVTQRVWFGDSNEAKLGAGEAGSITLPKGQLKNLKASYTLNQPQLTAPLEKGQVVGTIDFKLNDKTIEQRPLIVMESVKEGGFFSRMIDFVLMKLHGWFGSWFS